MRWLRKIAETTKSLKICYKFNMIHIHFKIVRRQTEMTQQQRVSRSSVTERAVGESRQRPPLAVVLEENILSTRNNKSNVMKHVRLSER